MARLNIPAGTQFGHLTTTGNSDSRVCLRKRRVRIIYWECVCDCGNTVKVISHNLRHTTRSCGCCKGNRVGGRGNATNDAVRNLREYRAWHNMKGRCLNPRDAAFHHYGGRGITICKEWINSFSTFYQDMGSRPSPQHSLERVNNDLGYSPENCVWATEKQQKRNRRGNHKVSFNGKTLCVSEWAEIIGIRPDTLGQRLKKGWTIERALNETLHITNLGKRK